MTGVQDRLPIDVPIEEIAAFCQRWKITEFALFGSVLRDDFGPESDVDILVTFSPISPRTLTSIRQMQDEIEALFKRRVDLVDRQSIERSPNYLRRKAIFQSARTIYRVA